MSLSDTAIRRAVVRNRPYKLYDAGGLFLLVMPSGGKWWRFKYRFNKKEKLLSLGTYPDISLKMARERRDQERKKLVERIDPAINRKAVKAAWQDGQANTFEVVAREWVDKQSAIWTPANVKKVIARGVFPKQIALGDRAVGWIEQEIDAWLAARIQKTRTSQNSVD